MEVGPIASSDTKRTVDDCPTRLRTRRGKIGCQRCHLALEASDAVTLISMLCSNKQAGNNLMPLHGLDQTVGHVAETIVPNL